MITSEFIFFVASLLKDDLLQFPLLLSNGEANVKVISPDYSWVFRHERQNNNKIRCCPSILSTAIAIAIGRTKIGVSA